MTRNNGLDPAKPRRILCRCHGTRAVHAHQLSRVGGRFQHGWPSGSWDPEDAIGSIAYCLACYGWKPEQPVFSPLNDRGAIALEPGTNSQYTMTEIESRRDCISTSRRFQQSSSSSSSPLVAPCGHDQYLIGHNNFYTITRYSHSVYYAMADIN